MNFVFRSYPAHPWISDWSFEPRGCNTAYRENCQDHFFVSGDAVGRIMPSESKPQWSLQVPAPQNSRINLLANGFCTYFERRKIRCGAEVICPEPGVLWGRFHNIPNPVLLSGSAIESDGDSQWVETDTLSALLVVREGSFCLVSKTHVRSDAVAMAEGYLGKDLEERLQGELDRRSGAAALFEDMSHHDSLAVLCAESMIKSLRPAEGKIPHAWSQSSRTEDPCFDVNELFPLAAAWSLIQPETAEELVLCALKIQTNAGALPVQFSPHTTYSVLEAPKPMMAKTAEKVWSVRQDGEFLDKVLPMIRRHLQWMLHHFDPKRRNVYTWKNQNEPIVPGVYETDLASVDLATLLITEIEALNRMRRHSSQPGMHQPLFADEHAALENSIEQQFWNDAENAFSNAYVRDRIITLRGFPELTPLLWKSLPQAQKSAIMEHLREAEVLPGQHSVLSWHQSSMEDKKFPLFQQFLLMLALKAADPHGTMLNDFSRLTIQGFLEWHTLSLEEHNTLHINSSTAAYIITVQAMHKYRYHAKGAVGGYALKLLRKVRADRTDLVVVAATLLVLFCVHTYYDMKNAPLPLATLHTEMTNAYAEKDVDATMRTCIAIMDAYPEEAGEARLLAANILMMTGKYAQAAELLRTVRAEYPDSPGAMISLGLAEQLQGDFTGASTNYYEFCYLFDEIFPDVVQEVNRFRYLMQEGFKTPPKWQEIYRYQFMHELD